MWRVGLDLHQRMESLQLPAFIYLGDLPMDDGLGFEPRSTGPKPAMLPNVAPSVNGATGGIRARTPALATRCSARRTPIACWWSRGDLNPRSAVCKTAVLPLNDGPTSIQLSKNRRRVRLFSGASNGFRTRSCGLTNRRACPYTMLAMEPHLRFELSPSALRKRRSS